MAKIRRRQRREVQGADLTPMIDVVFLLLVFFMVATNFVEETQQFPVELPKADEAEVAKLEDVLSISVFEFEQDKPADERVLFRIDNEEVSHADLFKRIQAEKDSRELSAVVVKADKDARYQDIITVISCLHGNGIENFSLAVMSQ
ncbi:ExbD/TolR family protein [Cerasicoccus fimbriatus]|uniref:ExbD/TolR family protein n=1 Tax=Cerasicoccus fimbriatus TaxID=3014554 RepID=UPI0022B3EE0A|nr:biopolymer transporter ExbD [Cerasicoccus sp. TK19100]